MLDATSRRREAAIVIAVAALALAIDLHRLGHLAIRGLDESFHAVVAQNLIAHPLAPILYEKLYLPVNANDWQNTHIWLHKGIVPLWQMALSMALLGRTTFAMRLPSALLSAASILLTYAIGRRLTGGWAPVFAAVLQAFCPELVALTQGMVFSDHIDAALLFYVESSIWLMLLAGRSDWPSSRRSWLAAAAGVAQGLAFLSKFYPALIAQCVAIVAMLMARSRAEDDFPRVRGRDVAIMFVAMVCAVAPWIGYCAVAFGHTLAFEQLLVLRHLTSNVEGWGAPWDRVVFDYMLVGFHRFYPMLLAAIVLLAWRPRGRGVVLLLAWFLIGVIPHVAAASKTPTATLIAWPAGWLLLGVLLDRAFRGDWPAIAAIIVTAVLALFFGGKIPTGTRGYPDVHGYFVIFREHAWVAWHAAAGIAAAMAVVAIRLPVQRARYGAIAAAVLALVLLGRLGQVCWNATWLGGDAPAFVDIGRFVRERLPANTVVLVTETQKLDHMTAMFYCSRDAYALNPDQYDRFVHVIAAGGGLPVILSKLELPLPKLRGDSDGWTLYAAAADEFHR